MNYFVSIQMVILDIKHASNLDYSSQKKGKWFMHISAELSCLGTFCWNCFHGKYRIGIRWMLRDTVFGCDLVERKEKKSH